MGSRQTELMGILYFMVDFKNKSYQLKFFKIVLMLYVLEYKECNAGFYFVKKLVFYKARM